ncbi:MAG: ABC transporter ATP-binding protein [Ornithinimicrobium sp.]
MRDLPLADPGTPDIRSPHRYLWWLARGQLGLLALNALVCSTWLVTQALIPLALGQAIDQGIVADDRAALTTWTLAIVALAFTGAVFGTLWHRNAVINWMHATYRTMQVVGNHVLRAGQAVTRATPTGEVVSVVATDATRIANLYESSGLIVAAGVSYAVVAAILLSQDGTLGLIVLIGVPVLTLLLSVVLKPLQRRQNAAREAAGELATLGADTVTGLRVLRGVGGEGTFLHRYDEQSAQVLARGTEVAPVHATLDAARVLLPGIVVVLVTWQGARLVQAEALEPGDLVTFYGTAAYLALPLSFVTGFVSHYIRAKVGAAKVIRLLSVPSDLDTSATEQPPAPTPRAPAPLLEPVSGLRVQPGLFTAVVTGSDADAHSIADRLGRMGPTATPATWGGAPLAAMPLRDVRRRVVVAEGDATLFSGRLRDGLCRPVLGPPERSPSGCTDRTLDAAIHTASAEDVIDALPDGIDSDVTERGRSFSGGQRQRLALVRALVADPEVLILVEPTSAVDAHTEARIGRRLGPARRGLSTVVFTSSPLLLEHVDEVHLVLQGRVVASGSHHDLLDNSAAYRDVVLRGAEQVRT